MAGNVTVEDVFTIFKGRRAGLIKAFTTGMVSLFFDYCFILLCYVFLSMMIFSTFCTNILLPYMCFMDVYRFAYPSTSKNVNSLYLYLVLEFIIISNSFGVIADAEKFYEQCNPGKFMFHIFIS